MLALLQEDGRMSITDLADRLPLSVSATRERMRRLERTGVIDGYTVLVNPDAMGRTIQALVDVRFGQESTESMEQAIRDLPSVVNAMHLTGRFDAQLQVLCRDVAELDSLLFVLKDERGAAETNTRLVLSTIEGFPRSLK